MDDIKMRTEEQDWQDLEKKLKPKTIYCPRRKCTLVHNILNVLKKPYVFVTNKIFHIKKG